MPTTTITVDAVLFDMDGTLVDSTQGVVGAWETFARTYPGLDVQKILNTSHGVRTVENLRLHCGIEDPEILQSEAERFETEIVNSSRRNGSEGIVLLPGVRGIIETLLPSAGTEVRDKPRWAICTSATRTYALSALQIAGVPVPSVFVTADDVERGKPAPDPYLLGAKLCGVNPQRCLVVEDAPAGVRSGSAAGCKTLALITSHTREQMELSEPDFLVQNLASVKMSFVPEGVQVDIST